MTQENHSIGDDSEEKEDVEFAKSKLAEYAEKMRKQRQDRVL